MRGADAGHLPRNELDRSRRNVTDRPPGSVGPDPMFGLASLVSVQHPAEEAAGRDQSPVAWLQRSRFVGGKDRGRPPWLRDSVRTGPNWRKKTALRARGAGSSGEAASGCQVPLGIPDALSGPATLGQLGDLLTVAELLE
jgi:hypothetical protein